MWQMYFRHTLRSVWGEFVEHMNVYEYSKPLGVNGKSMKCLRSVKILCSYFFDASTSFTFLSGKYLKIKLSFKRFLSYFTLTYADKNNIEKNNIFNPNHILQ